MVFTVYIHILNIYLIKKKYSDMICHPFELPFVKFLNLSNTYGRQSKN